MWTTRAVVYLLPTMRWCVLLCVVGAVASLDTSNWMRDLMPVIGQHSFMELTLPGTHDSLSFGQSNVVSDDANDIPLWLAEILHSIKDFEGVGDFIRNQVLFV